MELKPAATSTWTPGELPSALAGPRAILLFGPDEGGVFEFARLAASSANACETWPAAGMAPEDALSILGSGSLFGGSSSLRLDGVEDKMVPAITKILDGDWVEGSILILTAGELKTTSKLRKLFADRKDCVSAALYAMRDREIETFVRNRLKTLGLGLDRDAGVGAHVSGDRALASRACEILALHALGRGASSVSRADVASVLDAVDEAGISEPLDLALDGRTVDASTALWRRLGAGESFVGMLRVFAQRVFRIRAMLETGLSPSEAVAGAKPPVFWTEREYFIRLLGRMSISKVDRMLALIDETETRIIEGRIPAEAAMGSLLFDIATHRNWKAAA